MAAMTLVVAVFAVVYAGMMLGRIPGLALDRTGLALLGALVLLATESVSMSDAMHAVDMPTMALLFGLMVLSAQFRLSGFYSKVVMVIHGLSVSPPVLLGIVIGVVGVLSAVLANDIVCLAMAPVLIDICVRRKLNPKPFLLGLACAANVGSAATLIGNPQNILVGQVLHLSFSGYLFLAGVPSFVGLLAVWAVLIIMTKSAWICETEGPESEHREFSLWQTSKGALVTVVLIACFLFSGWPREILALGAAGVLLMSRRMHSREVLGLVDWQLLVLFVSLFVINHALAVTGLVAESLSGLAQAGFDLEDPVNLYVSAAVLSNLVSNVPAVMLLLPSANGALSGAVLALASTLAGNLFIVGSIANIIVVEQAALRGIRIGWREHARIGVPTTIITLLIAAGWLWLLSSR